MKHLLACFLILPERLEKSAHMLALRGMSTHGWRSTVVTLGIGRPGTVSTEDWNGVRVIRIVPTSLAWRTCNELYRLRGLASNGRMQIGPWRMPRSLGRIISQVLSPITAIASLPDKHVHAYRELTAEAISLSQAASFDVVLSLYHPMTSHDVASRLSQKLRIPWVALTKDFYSWPPCLVASRVGRFVNRLKRGIEKRRFKGANCVLAVNDYLASHVRELAPAMPVKTFTHCYDEATMKKTDLAYKDASRIFRLVSVGLVSRSDEQDLRSFFSAVGELHDANEISAETFRVRFVGRGEDIVLRCAKSFGCDGLLELVPQVPYPEAAKELRSATCLLFQQVRWGSRRRLADYFGSRQPILAFPEFPEMTGIMSDPLLRAYGAARIASGREELKSEIASLVTSYQSRGSLHFASNHEFVEQYGSLRRARDLATILDDCR